MSDLIDRQKVLELPRDVTRNLQGEIVEESIDIEAIKSLPSAELEPECKSCRYRNLEWYEEPCDSCTGGGESCHYKPEPERLTDDDFETIRIHLNALKERLCNQRRWKEAEDYERLINRFISFASAQPEHLVKESGDLVKDLVNDCINRQDAIDALDEQIRQCDKALSAFDISMRDEYAVKVERASLVAFRETLEYIPSAEPERLTDDDFETIRIHLSAYKEKLGNQHRWKEAEEYQRIIDRFVSFASAEPERKKGKWIGYKDDDPQWKRDDGSPIFLICSECHETVLNNGSAHWNFCPNCGSYNGGEKE